MSHREGMRPVYCPLCGRPCYGALCRAHDDLEVDAVPADPLESLTMQAAETLGEDAQAATGTEPC